MDCNDETDEDSCELMLIDEGKYRKSNVPASQINEGKLEIGVWFDVMDVAEVNEPEVSAIWEFKKFFV